MKKSTAERLSTVLKLAKIRERQSAVRLAENIRNAQANSQQQEQLEHYSAEYCEQFKQKNNYEKSAAELENFQRFYRDLDKAKITQQERKVLADNQLDQAKQEWQGLYAKGKNLESLIEKKQLQENREKENISQREMDDRVNTSKNK